MQLFETAHNSTERIMVESGKSKLPKRVLWAAVAAAIIGMLFYNVMPLYLGSLQDATGFSSEQIGIVGSVFFFGLNLVSASSFFWVRRIHVRAASLFATFVIIVLLPASAAFSPYTAVLIMTLIVGGASGGLASIGATVISGSDQSTRWFGIKVAAESAAAVILLFALPATLIPVLGFMGTAVGMSCLVLLLTPLVFFMVKGGLAVAPGQGESEHASKLRQKSGWPVWSALLAMLVMCAGGAAIWAFEERIGNLYGFDAIWVGRILGISLIFAVVGSLAAGPLGVRFDSRRSYAIAAGLMILGVFAIAGSSANSAYYAIGACVFMLGWGGAVPLLFAKIADTDPNGRHIALSVPALGIGSMIGPAVAGFIFASGSISVLQWMSVGAIALSAVLMFMAGRGSLR